MMQGQSIKNQVYEDIMKDILDGVYEANAIINERTLIEKYGVSKTPVREALVQLCSENVLNNISRFGYQITPILPGQIAEIIEYRKMIELGALERCFLRLTAEQIGELKRQNEEAERIAHTMDSKLHWEANNLFHRTLCSYCNNSYIRKSLEDAMNVCTRISNQYFTKLWNESRISDGSSHVLLVEALEAGDLERAKIILGEDVEAFKKEIL
ncbi:MAG: GntR family transcriptional regulator [Lacrimispora sp.]|uniref:GntR family transcriptional regulator n=1 Tax=Lacrimispora sp. TaxID=2719234 RepID=UPI0039E403DB